MTTKPTKKEAHVFWIDLAGLRDGYAIWKAEPPRGRGRKTPPPRVCVGGIDEDVDFPTMEAEFVFAPEDLESAFSELADRKKVDGDYGGPVEIGETGIDLYREDRHSYVAWAPCGERVDLTASQLRLLVAAVRDLEVSRVP